MGQHLTTDDLTRIVDAYETGTSAQGIAADFGVSTQTIYNHLHRAGVALRRYTRRNGEATVKTEPLHLVKVPTQPDTNELDDWFDRAICRDGDTELFYPTSTSLLAAEPAKRICRACPVMQQCRTYALARREEHGVWGGLSANERRALLKFIPA